MDVEEIEIFVELLEFVIEVFLFGFGVGCFGSDGLVVGGFHVHHVFLGGIGLKMF